MLRERFKMDMMCQRTDCYRTCMYPNRRDGLLDDIGFGPNSILGRGPDDGHGLVKWKLYRINTPGQRKTLGEKASSPPPPCLAPSARSILKLHPRDVHSTSPISQMPHDASKQADSGLLFFLFISLPLFASSPASLSHPCRPQGCWWFDG